ncbi:endochitinase At2g43610-like isoform X4 [Bradysia coprophila]|uniref:endochitinase At2g43610-like isoform X4 n=1 Tax=Bradysia coprophila TaxID=38358 RepID=UPI00187D9764|nr:endochitinase At2g43610-like isoform X4 [Bradysia coprophila]
MTSFLILGLVVLFCVGFSQQQSCSITSNQDINLPDLAVRSGQPQESCCSICQSTPGCKGFAYNGYEGGTCWLKAGTGPLIYKENVNVGILGSTASGGACSIRSNQDINLPDLQARYGQPQEACCGICKNTLGCKGFAWNAYEGGTCWLKAGTGPVVYMEGVNVGILNGNGGSDNSGGNNNGALISFDEFANAVVNSNGYPRPSEAQYNAFIQGLPKGLIATKQEAAMALTQFLHESDGLRAKREYRCQDSGCPGEYVTSGCDGPNQRYYGRGYIQLTWCYNYRAASQDLYNDNRLVSDADMVARDENVAWNTAFWFWKANVHNIAGVADGAFGVTTRAINGGLECNNSAGHPIARQRYAMYGRVRAAFGLGGPGSEWGCYN